MFVVQTMKLGTKSLLMFVNKIWNILSMLEMEMSLFISWLEHYCTKISNSSDLLRFRKQKYSKSNSFVSEQRQNNIRLTANTFWMYEPFHKIFHPESFTLDKLCQVFSLLVLPITLSAVRLPLKDNYNFNPKSNDTELKKFDLS